MTDRDQKVNRLISFFEFVLADKKKIEIETHAICFLFCLLKFSSHSKNVIRNKTKQNTHSGV